MDVIITEPEEPTPPADEQTATLYIGTRANGFTEYPMTYDGELTAEKLIQGIADLTAWDLTLAEDVISGKGWCRDLWSRFSSPCRWHMRMSGSQSGRSFSGRRPSFQTWPMSKQREWGVASTSLSR